ncbi:MAG: sigma-70 family RNA polymerase sigma factor [Oscillospiraceae bacterium]|nr:sigma-70 family RNA polymerase sigma factor [Oscillospiraceae bacterium]
MSVRKGLVFSDEGNMSDYSDEELVRKFKASDRNEVYISELIYRYYGMIKGRAAVLGRGTLNTEDLVQEGLMGFFSAVRSYDSQKGVPFSSFAYTCVVNRIRNAAQRFSGVMRSPDRENGQSLEDGVSDDTYVPEKVFMERETFTELRKILTDREYDVLYLFMAEMSYKDIAARLGISVKAVDNAIQRIRKKLRSIYSCDTGSDTTDKS